MDLSKRKYALNKNKIGQSGIIIVLILAILGSILGGLFVYTVTSLQVAGTSFNTESTDWEYESDSWVVRSHIELSDRYNDGYYSTAWKSHSGQDLAEPIFIEDQASYIEIKQKEKGLFFDPKIISPDYDNSCIDYWYEWYLNGVIYRTNPIQEPYHLYDGDIYEGDWDVPYDTWIKFPITVDNCPIVGDETGTIEVVLKANFKLMHQGWFGDDVLEYEGESDPMSKDGAYLKSGAGKLTAVEELVEVGDEAKILVETGIIHNQGWTLRFYPPPYVGFDSIDYGVGEPLGSFEGQDDFRGYVNFPVPDHWFEIGQEDSQCRVELWNPLWTEATTCFWTIDNKELAPVYGEDPNSLIENVNGVFKVGEKIHVYVHASPNNQTLSPISHFWVDVYYGTAGSMSGFSQDYIIQHKKYLASATGDADFTFNIPRDGGVIIRVNAVDQDGRTSDTGYYGFIVYPVETGFEGFGDWTNTTFPFLFTLGAILGMLIIVGFIAFFGWMMFKGVIKWNSIPAWIIFGIVIGILAYIIHWIGSTPTIGG